MKRVVVIGSGGSGKSTFSLELGRATGLPVIHLDREFWRSGWEETTKEEWHTRVVELLKRDRWIMDGNFGGTREMRMREADTIVFLDLPRWVCLYRILKRTLKYYGRSRPDMTEGCDEGLDLEFIGWVWNYRNRSRGRVLDELNDLTGKNVIVLQDRRQVRDFLAKCETTHVRS